MSQENTPHEDKTLLMVKFHQEDTRKQQAFALLCELAFDDKREAKPAEAALILSHLHYVLRYKLNLFYAMWSPEDIQDYADGTDYPKPTLDQAKDICHNLSDYDIIHSEITEAVRNELYILSKNVE